MMHDGTQKRVQLIIKIMTSGPPVYDSPFFHLADKINIPYLKKCAECHRPGEKLCSSCKGVYYCSEICQANHWKAGGHKKFCKSIQSALEKYRLEKEELHHCDDNLMGTPMDYFHPDNDILGNFWGYVETRPFCRALGNLVNKYSVADATKKSIYESIIAVLKLHYLNRSDNMGYRDTTPALFLRIDQDQLAFDFIRWHVLYPDDHYDWGDPRLPFLHYWKTDRSEDLLTYYDVAECDFSLAHIAIYVLIKVRLYLHLVNVNAMYAMLTLLHGDHDVPQETGSPLVKLQGQAGVHHVIKEYLVGVAGHGFGDFRQVRDKEAILNQIHAAFQKGEELNPRIWKALVNPKPLLSQPTPSYYSMKSAEECYFTVERCLPAWTAHPDCLLFLINHVKTRGGGTEYDCRMERY
jgi:GTPase-activating protein that regulates ARFs (ADP-ribosylation factors), involved in ARF-mediated vesicular transport